MPFNADAVKQHLSAFDFRKLFVSQLGWDKPGVPLDVPLDGHTFHFVPVAEKRGLQVFECVAPASAGFPDYPTRLKLERHVAKLAKENILIFTDAAKTRQTWLWVKRESNGPPRPRQESFAAGDTGERLAQKLQHLLVELDEEEAFTLPDALERRKLALDVEKVTKKFFERFQKEHAAFLKFIKGLPEESRAWYASLMLNRLMFVYFIQKKRFLNGDIDYLRNKLAEVQKDKGKDKFGAFYKHFLMRLFHEGLGKKKDARNKDFDKLLGDVPYLNGGLFDVHELEAANTDIQIPDAAFTKLFEFFDLYDWHLDDRPLKKDNEINPDVLGFIFEKYINQKQMGAYYTKEDITGYITRNALLPFVLSRVQELCAVAFQPGGTVWKMLKDDPDRYIYAAVRHGVELPLPPDIAVGIADVSKRGGWNRSATEGFALPTETWREHVARRLRCEELRAKLRDGKVTAVNDLVTLNLDIVRFVTDVIEECEGADLLLALYQTLTTVTVLDPTCGSGAFLFAALNILEPLYDACLERMQDFVTEADANGKPDAKERHTDFRAVLTEAKRHPNRRYFIFRSVVVNNLYGVDIMDEAVEICKLRLFLKLVSQVESVKDIEPLPDIDFNIRPGNTLVGFATADDARKAMTAGIDLSGEAAKLEKELAELAAYFNIFRDHQTKLNDDPTRDKQLSLSWSKAFLRKRLREASDKLDRYLADMYVVDANDEKKYAKWHDSHKPFHWFAEFYGIMTSGGFDVIIGNPPYVEYSKVREQYTVVRYASAPCNNIYAFVLERSLSLCDPHGRCSLIVPLSLLCTDRMASIRAAAVKGTVWTAGYDIRPSSLFEGVAQRLCIVTKAESLGPTPALFVGGYRRWQTIERPHLMPVTTYGPCALRDYTASLPKLASPVEVSILSKLGGDSLEAFTSDTSAPAYVHRICRYYIKALDFVPYFRGADGTEGRSEDYKEFRFLKAHRNTVLALLNSSLFYWFWRTHGDGYHCGYGDVNRFHFRPIKDAALSNQIEAAFDHLMQSLKATSKRKSIQTQRGSVGYQEFYPAESKPLMDVIDALLAKHYGFTAEELDFIVNYDIKYRLGTEEADGDEE